MPRSHWIIWLSIATSSHAALASRLRLRLAPVETPEETVRRLQAEAEAELPRDLDAVAETSDDTYQQSASMFWHLVEEEKAAQSHLWGLGIVSMCHQWERHAKEVLTELGAPPLRNMATVKEICLAMICVGYNVRASSAFPDFEIAHLIGNVVKHGGPGPAFAKLAKTRPGLFTGPLGDYTGKPAPELLHLEVTDFDRAAAAIAKIWNEFETENQPRAIAPSGN